MILHTLPKKKELLDLNGWMGQHYFIVVVGSVPDQFCPRKSNKTYIYIYIYIYIRHYNIYRICCMHRRVSMNSRNPR